MMPSAECVLPLVTLLGDANEDVRIAASEALAAHGEMAIDQLLSALRDEDTRVRVGVAAALALLGNPSALRELLDGLQDPEPEVRGEAAQGLGRLGNHEALPGLAKALHDDEERVRRAAAFALRLLGGDGLEQLRAASRDADPRVAQAALSALS